jgi:hypothetical protein
MEKHVMKKMLSAASVLVIAAGAFAAPFNMLALQAGGGLNGINGTGFTTSGAGFYNRQGGTTTGVLASDPSTWQETASNTVAYDSYLTISGQGPSRNSQQTIDDNGLTESLSSQLRSFYGAAYDSDFAAPGIIVGPGSHIGASGSTTGQAPYAAATPVNRARAGIAKDPSSGPAFEASGINPANGREGIFLAQLTVNRGATLSGGGDVELLTSFGVVDSKPMVLDGAQVVFQTAPGVFQPLVLRSYLVASLDNVSHSRSGGNTGSGTGGTQRFGNADVYHIWVEVVPAPTAVAAFGLAGLAGLRRRRA